MTQVTWDTVAEGTKAVVVGHPQEVGAAFAGARVVIIKVPKLEIEMLEAGGCVTVLHRETGEAALIPLTALHVDDVDQRLEAEHHEVQEAAALLVQGLWRGRVARTLAARLAQMYRADRRRVQEEVVTAMAATTIQAAARAKLQRDKLARYREVELTPRDRPMRSPHVNAAAVGDPEQDEAALAALMGVATDWTGRDGRHAHLRFARGYAPRAGRAAQ